MIICKFYAVSDNLKEPAFPIFHLSVLRNGPAVRRCRLDDPKTIKIIYPCVCFSVIITTAISVTVTVLTTNVEATGLL
jgi:hypothetical protein